MKNFPSDFTKKNFRRDRDRNRKDDPDQPDFDYNFQKTLLVNIFRTFMNPAIPQFFPHGLWIVTNPEAAHS
jgi:hypothetical protein